MSTPFIYGETSNHTIGGSVIPDTDVMYNLGSTTKRWRDLYLSGNTINIGGTTISRQEDGSIGITDTLAVGGPTPATLKVSKIMSATGDIINMSGATLSNVSIAANKIKVTGIPEPSYIAPELRILNEDTSSGLVVNQTGQTSAGVADFQDHGISALNIAKGGSITVGNLLLPDEIPVQSTVTTTSTELSTAGMEQQSINTEIVASDGSTVELFGRATSTSDDGKSFIVGAPLDSFGSAYIYKWNGTSWAETKLTPSDGVAGNNFGTSVAMSADGLTVAVGAPGPATAPGAVYVYKYSGSTWVETKKAADFTNVNVSSYLYDNVWTLQPVAGNNYWRSICWSPELYMFVAVSSTGVGNRVMTSVDGKAWIGRASAADNNWTSVCWAPELSIFVAVATSGTDNRVMTSPNGITWTTRVSAANYAWSSVCWSSELSLLVAVSRAGTKTPVGGTVMTSPNGINWTLGASAGARVWTSVCWAPQLSLFVAVASSGTNDRVMTSPDGFTWTFQPSAADNSWTSVCWAPEISLFVAVASSGTNRVMTSQNGQTWTLSITNSSNQDGLWYSVCWAPELSQFISTGAFASDITVTSIMKSSNGITWTTAIPDVDDLRIKYAYLNLNCVCWAPQLMRFAVVLQNIFDWRGIGENVLTNAPMYDSITSTYSITDIWNSEASTFNANWTSMCWSPKLSLFVAIGYIYDGNGLDSNWLDIYNQLATSPDGLVWTARNIPLNIWVSICWSAELEIFVAISKRELAGHNNGYIMTSTDGLTWTNRVLGFVPSGDLYTIIWAPELSQFVILGKGCTLISTNGVNWVEHANPETNYNWYSLSICWAPELLLYVAVAWGNYYGDTTVNYRVLTSTNGTTWTGRSSSATDTYDWRSVCWSPDLQRFVAVGRREQGPIAISDDGISWSSVPQPSVYSAQNYPWAYWAAVLWIPEIQKFIATGGEWQDDAGGYFGRVMVSPDGITWTPLIPDPYNISCTILCYSPEKLRLVVMNYASLASGDRRIMTSDVTLLTTSTPSTAGNSYGNALALSKDAATLAVGAPNTKIISPLKESAGAAYAYKWNGSAWGAQTLLQASDIIDSQKFGVSIAASTNGTSLVVGSELGNGAYVYKLVNSAWTETKAIASEPIVAADGYSTSCAISADGTRFVIGAPGKGTNAGAAYIYEWSGSAWVETKLTPTVAGSGFGQSVAMLGDGNSVLIGEVYTNSNTGDAYFFMRTNGTWTEGTKLVAPNAEAGDKFGTSVALSSQYAFVGATATDASAADQGSVYVFNYGPALVPQEITVTTTTNVTTMVPAGPAIKVIGSALFDGDVDVQGTHTASSLNVSNAGTGTAMTINQSNVTQPIVDFKDDGLTVFKIVPGGNIGVGTTLPAYKLHVVGTTFSSAGFMSYSDSSLKTNVQEIKGADAISIVSQMRGVRYDRIKKEEDPRRRVGLIAQEVESVLPEIVRTDASGMKSVAYGDSVAVLIQAIKEQQKEIDALETMI